MLATSCGGGGGGDSGGGGGNPEQPAATAPSITSQPVAFGVAEPAVATFSTVATGTAPLTYQWQRNVGGSFTDLPGATGASYTTPATVRATDNGAQFRVVVSNAAGSVTSSAATLTVTPAPVSLTALTAGKSHTCALTTAGGVKCWGDNGNRQLGDGSTTDRLTSVDVPGLGSGVTALSAGNSHTCALTTAGGVKCWGYNLFGQLGDGSNTDRLTLVDVSGLSSGVTALSAGQSHTCALTTAGGVKCWGDNQYGQLGDGSGAQRPTPVDVSGLGSGVIAISAGAFQTCALTTAGGVKCWGYNLFGELGDGSNTRRLTPVDVSGLGSGVAALSAGAFHTCALTTAGGVKCWGANLYGELGDGSGAQRLTPVDVSGLGSGVTALNADSFQTCALTTAGGVKCWGKNDLGQLGDGSTTQRLTPVDVFGLGSGVTAIGAGGDHACALTTAGGFKCWGDNASGQLGDGSTTQRLTPVDVSGLGSGGMVTPPPVVVPPPGSGGMMTRLDAGGGHTCRITTAGGVKCWGNNTIGVLGDGSVIDRLTPVDVSGLGNGVIAISAGQFHSCALTTAGGVKCWGANGSGELGDGSTTQRLTPVDVSGLGSGVIAISAGGRHTCALTTAGGVKCWGYNISGQLGDGSRTERLTPVDVSSLGSGVAALSAGRDHTCALTTAGGAKCWGANGYGELGDGSDGGDNRRLTPVDVFGLGSGVAALSAGAFHTCALTTAGGVKCWGYNTDGLLGDGSITRRLTPVDVSGLASGVIAISAGEYHNCALTTAGGVKCWGSSSVGQIGDRSLSASFTPVDVFGLGTGVTALSAGQFHNCALTTAGGVKCWGANGLRQLGNGGTTNSPTPVDVLDFIPGPRPNV